MLLAFWSGSEKKASALEPDNVYLICGEDSIDLETLENWWHAIDFFIQGVQSGVIDILEFIPPLGHQIVRIKVLRDQRLRSAKMPLLNLLQDLRGTEATDTRDKVYCMLSFATDVKRARS